MRRIVNFRCFLSTALVALLSIVVATAKNDVVTIVASIMAAVLFCVSFIVFAIMKRPKAYVSIALCFVVFAVCAFHVTVYRTFRVSELESGTKYSFVGSVEKVSVSGSTASCVMGSVTADGKKIKGNVSLTVFDPDFGTAPNIMLGDRLYFYGEADYADVSDGRPGSFEYRNDIKYYVKVNAADVEMFGSDPGIVDAIHNRLRSVFDASLGAYAPIAYGMITGERNGISAEVSDAYSAAGIGHILAVSGLHIGFVTALVAFVLRKLKAGRRTTVIVTTASLVFYCFLAGFSPSVVRASVMCFMGLIAHFYGARRDPMSTLGLAFTVILLVKPYYLFDAGFQMSAGAVFGLILFAEKFGRVLGRFLPKFIASPLSASASAQLGITPVMIVVFNLFTPYAVLVNLVVIPLVSVAFSLLVALSVLVMAVPVLGPILLAPGAILAVITAIADAVARLPYATVVVFGRDVVYLGYALMYAASGFVMSGKLKIPVVALAVALAAAMITTENLPAPKEYDLVTESAYADVTSLVRVGDATVAVGDVGDYTAVDDMMRAIRARSIAAVYLTKLDSVTAGTLTELNAKYPIGEVFVPYYAADHSGIYDMVGTGVQVYLIDETHESAYGVGQIRTDEGFVGYTFSAEDRTAVLLGYGTNENDLPPEVVNEAVVIRSYTYRGGYPDRMYITNYENTFESKKPMSETVAKSVLALDFSSGEMIRFFV